MQKEYAFTKKLTVTALLIALAIIINMFRFTVPVAGASVMRVSFSGPFLHLIAILFGPLYGGIAGGLSDVISFLLKPEGGYLYPLTIVAILKGATIGLLWNIIKDFKTRRYHILYMGTFAVIGIVSIINIFTLIFFKTSAYALFLTGIGDKVVFATYWLLSISAVGILLYMLVWFLLRNKNEKLEQSVQVFIAVGIPSLIFTTINTVIFQKYGFFGEKAFALVLIPRVIEEMIMIVLNTYVIVVLLSAYERVIVKVSR